MDRGEHERDDLWDLLGKARPTEVSPFFARNVIRKIRETEAEAPRGAWGYLIRQMRPLGFRPLQAVLAGVTLALIALFAVRLDRFDSGNPSAGQPVQATASAVPNDRDLDLTADFDVIADLDFLVAYSETSVWTGED